MFKFLARLQHQGRIYRKNILWKSAVGGSDFFVLAVFMVFAGIIAPIPYAIAGILYLPILVVAGLLMLFTLLLTPFGIALL